MIRLLLFILLLISSSDGIPKPRRPPSATRQPLRPPAPLPKIVLLGRIPSRTGTQQAEGGAENEYTDGGGEEEQEQEQEFEEIETTTAPINTTTNSTKTPTFYKPCTFKYIPRTCKISDICDTKKLCVQITGDPCCAPPQGDCPTPLQLGVKCVKGHPVNWCSRRQDCSKGALCCDTGCRYNICIEQNEM